MAEEKEKPEEGHLVEESSINLGVPFELVKRIPETEGTVEKRIT